ncbi:hypothetical protein [Streptomyces sp. SID9727]|uniref:hypothetical protein n=1 Tax=Streptomyces sp. SID9727 TaxID=2706114 RepID=UPI0013C5D8B6|nr:hypothetical protein [Streptomyces sp. SID9727]NEC68805.1 hypothetical protein [Streptomyces sp. SID9727]
MSGGSVQAGAAVEPAPKLLTCRAPGRVAEVDPVLLGPAGPLPACVRVFEHGPEVTRSLDADGAVGRADHGPLEAVRPIM